MSDHKDEKVLILPTETVNENLDKKEGFIPHERGASLSSVLLLEVASAKTFEPRSTAETNLDAKQPIPYMIFRCGDLYFVYQRDKGGEKRLDQKFSIGVGGHVNSEDSDGVVSAFINGIKRELKEEVGYSLPVGRKLHFLGFINDNSNSVGKVHLGLVYVIDVDSTDVLCPEESMINRSWETLESLAKFNLESWSRLAIDYLTKE